MSSPVFNPDVPVADTLVDSGELREQFNALNNRDDELAGAIEERPFKPMSVAPLSLAISNPPTQAEVEAVRDGFNELLAALQA